MCFTRVRTPLHAWIVHSLLQQDLTLNSPQFLTFSSHCCKSRISIFSSIKKAFIPRVDYYHLYHQCKDFPFDFGIYWWNFLLQSMLIPCTKRVSSKCFFTKAWISSLTFWSSLRWSLELSTSYLEAKYRSWH